MSQTLTQSGVDTKNHPVLRGVIDVDLPGATISRHIYGHFAEHLGRCIYGGFYVGERSRLPTVDGIRMDVVDALKRLNVPNLRWPGGLFADTYHWRDGIGPHHLRPTSINTNWGGVVENNAFGTHEFMRLCELLEAEPYISLNVATGTVREASEWIEYLTGVDDSSMVWLRRQHQRDDPWKVPFCGLGNEPWGGGGAFQPETYAQAARTFGQNCRDFGDNRLYRVAAGANSDDYRWTKTLMEALGFQIGSGKVIGEGTGTFQAISFHHYSVPEGDWQHKGSATGFSLDDYYKIIAAAARVETLLAGHSAIMDAYDPHKTIGLVLDEWGTWYDAEPGVDNGALFQQNTLRDAIVAGIHFDAFHRHADRLVMANIAQTVNVLQAVILTYGDTIVLTPTYHVFEMNKEHQDARALDVHIVNQPPTIASTNRVFASASVSASVKDGHVLVSLTNVHAECGIDVDLEFRGADLGQPHGRILTADRLDAHNTVADPTAVTPHDFDDVSLNNNTLHVNLPPHCFATVKMSINTKVGKA